MISLLQAFSQSEATNKNSRFRKNSAHGQKAETQLKEFLDLHFTYL